MTPRGRAPITKAMRQLLRGGTGHENVLRLHCQRRLHSDVEAACHVPRHIRTSAQPVLTCPRSVMYCLHPRILSLAGWLQLNTCLSDWATMYACWGLQTPLCASAPGISAQLFSNPSPPPLSYCVEALVPQSTLPLTCPPRTPSSTQTPH